VVFKEIKLTNLRQVNGDCNPYLKYDYSKRWAAVSEGKGGKAIYSEVQQHTTNPAWQDLPEIRFHASLREILHESVVLHVTHSGKVTNTTLGRCNLLFRTLVDNGKSFKDEDLISFKGPLKVDDAEIEGLLIFKFLPLFAQMKAVNVIRKAVHTEKGIFDAVTLLPGLPLPKVPIILSDDKPAAATDNHRSLSEGGNRQRSQTVSHKPSAWKVEEKSTSKFLQNQSTSLDDSQDDKVDDPVDERIEVDEKVQQKKEEPISPPKKDHSRPPTLSESGKKKSIYGTSATDDLISFSPMSARKNRSVTQSATTAVRPDFDVNFLPAKPANPNPDPPFIRQPVRSSSMLKLMSLGSPQQAQLNQQMQQMNVSQPQQTVFNPFAEQTQPTFQPEQPFQQPFQASFEQQQFPQQFAFPSPFPQQPFQPSFQQPVQQPFQPQQQPTYNPFAM